MSGPVMKPERQDVREDVLAASGSGSVLALMHRQNLLIDQQHRENVLLRLQVETLTWALASLRNQRRSGGTTTRVSSGSGRVTEGVAAEIRLPPAPVEPPRVSGVAPRRCLDCHRMFQPNHHTQFRCRTAPCKSEYKAPSQAALKKKTIILLEDIRLDLSGDE